MNRRDVLKALAAVPFAGAARARAQGAAPPVVGILYGASSEEWPNRLAAFRLGLAEAGYVEGRNLVVESRYAEGNLDRVPPLIAELVSLKVAVLVTPGTPVTAILGELDTPIAAADGAPRPTVPGVSRLWPARPPTTAGTRSTCCRR